MLLARYKMVYSHILWYCTPSQEPIQHHPFMLRERYNFGKRLLRQMKSIINDPWAKPLEVGDTGQKLLLNMYGGTGNDNLITKRSVLGSNCKFWKN